MKRSERIYHYIQEKSAAYTKERLTGQVGFDAQEIAAALDILRNNVSKELNELHRQDRIVKFAGRPVRYFDKETLETLLDTDFGVGPCQFQDIGQCRESSGESAADMNPFEHLIGADKSLKRQVEQAKAAILYPPDGLHTLIVGQTGVGKTLFAHMMFAYGKSMHRFGNEAPFITFNCADYYNNPQLLISHVFGHIKGAFTGADTAKEFEFTIELTAPDGKTLAETYKYTKTGVAGEQTLTLSRTDGNTKATVTGIKLKADDVYTIQGLPAGTTYKITETDYSSDGYSSSLSSEGHSGTITGGTTAKESVEVTNDSRENSRRKCC